MRLWWSFRSPYVPCFSIATEPVNVPGWLTAATLATRAPGKENRRWRAIIRPIPGAHPYGASASAIQNCSRQFCRLMSSDFRVGDQPASLQAIPSARVPAGGPGQPSTPHRFSAGPCHRCNGFILMTRCHRCKTSYGQGFLSPQGEGENHRPDRESVRKKTKS